MIFITLTWPLPLLAGTDDPVRRWWQEYDLRRHLDNLPSTRPPSPPVPDPAFHPCERYGRVAYNTSLGLGPYDSDDPIITYIIKHAPRPASIRRAAAYAQEIREVCYQHALD